jgi:multiple sugar transport system ATP-binding protein
MAEIILSDVEKYFGEYYVIRQLNLQIHDREFVVLLGPSGCGKTTTLRAIAGLEEIDRGRILIDGRPVQDLQAADRDIAFVFQLYALYPHLTAYENIAFPLRAARIDRSETDLQVRRVATSLGIEHLLALRPSSLSGGDMQRVAIGRALVRRPKALLMDEPIGALDAKLREGMRIELKRLHIQNGATTVYVTHDQTEAMALADRIAIMNDGVLQQVGTPTEVYHNPANLFVAQFVGSPVMNVSKAALRMDADRIKLVLGDQDGEFEYRGPLPRYVAEFARSNCDLTIGIRPEGVLVAHQQQDGFVRVTADIIEPLGAYDIVDLRLGRQWLRARTSSGFVARHGEPVWARLDELQLHFFDTTTGASLSEAKGA